jgi:vacuolar protein sorting-associated protein 13D
LHFYKVKRNKLFIQSRFTNEKYITGEVELENVPLKRDVLNQLGLPLQIHAGFVGKICFQIPLRKIRSEPWVISFEQLYLVAGPKDKTEV